MRKEDKKKLIANRRYIVGHLLDLESVLDYLIAKEIFTVAVRERIIYEFKVPRDRIRQTLDYICKCGPNAFQVFLEALVLSGNAHIAQILDSTYCDSDKCKLLIEREQLKQQQQQQQQISAACNRVTTTSSCCNSKKTSRIQSPIGLRYQEQTEALYSPRLLIAQDFTQKDNLLCSLTPIGNHSARSRHASPVVGELPMRHLSPQTSKFPITVASCQLNTNSNDFNDANARQDLDWDDINSLDLDFEVLQSDKKVLESDPSVYSMTQEPRGICLIINNEHFYDNDHQEIQDLRRYGTDLDASRLRSLFEKLKFDVKFEYDLTESELKHKIQLFAIEVDRYSHQYDAACLILLSHGTDGYIYGVDFENRINIDKDVLNLFDDVMLGKPKLFVFQACRGENFNQKVDQIYVEEAILKLNEMKMNGRTSCMTSTTTSATSLRCSSRSSSLHDFIDGRPIRTSLPSRSDFFIWYSSVRGFVSHRDSDGSPFLKCLVAVFSRYAKDLELIEMVRKVNLLMQQYEKKHCDDKSYFMLPVPEYHLTKNLFFNP